MVFAQHDNIILIGMPGAGKSTHGVLLAEAIGYDFIDTDLLIQRQARMTLGDYLHNHGYQALRQVEAEVIKGLNSTSSVIATGGSAVYSDEAMYHLKASGYVVYLQCALDVLDGRIASMSDRGIAAPTGQNLADVQAERILRYEHFADVTVDVSNQDSKQALASIRQQLPL